jgi:hypothetical protein
LVGFRIRLIAEDGTVNQVQGSLAVLDRDSFVSTLSLSAHFRICTFTLGAPLHKAKKTRPHVIPAKSSYSHLLAPTQHSTAASSKRPPISTYMSATQDLPSKDDFLNNIDIAERCDICLEAFDANHAPTRTTCGHTFGSTCLRKWIDSNSEQSNACPKCRTVLFKKPLQLPEYVAGMRPDDDDDDDYTWLEAVRNVSHAEIFVMKLWASTYRLHASTRIYESDIEGCVNMALYFTATFSPHELPFGLYLKSERWPAIQQVVKEMVAEHCRFGEEFRELDVAERWNVWIPRMSEAVGWELDDN